MRHGCQDDAMTVEGLSVHLNLNISKQRVVQRLCQPMR